MSEIPGLLTLWNKALTNIPEYPTYNISVAQEGAHTYRLDEKYLPYVSMIEKGGDPSEVLRRMYSDGLYFENPEYVPAKEGEYLRDADLRLVPDISENLRYRILVQEACKKSEEAAALQVALCRSSILYFANVFCWTFNPRLNHSTIPLITYPKQDDILKWCLWLIERKETGLIEKSRDMGASWCFVAVVMAYLTLFYDGKVCYPMSLKEDDVDDRTEDSLMGKYRFILNHLPSYMRGSWVDKSSGIDNKMSSTIPDTKSRVKGQLTMGTAGRGGRGTVTLNDEYAFVDDASKVAKALASLSDSNIILSTVNGMGNEFARMAHDPATKKVRFHWREHPMKNSQWALKERSKTTYTDESWSQEHEIVYESSTKGRVYPSFISFQGNEKEWCHIQEGEFVEYDPAFDVVLGMDLGIGDPTSAVFGQIKPTPVEYMGFTSKCLVLFEELEEPNHTVDWWAETILTKQHSQVNPLGYVYRHIVGDYRTGNQRDPKGKTWVKYLSEYGIHMDGRYNTEEAPILEVKRLLHLPGSLVINKKKCPNLVKAFQNWSYPVDKDTGEIKPGSKPYHNQWSHSMKAIAYLVDYVYGTRKKKERKNNVWNFKVLNKVAV